MAVSAAGPQPPNRTPRDLTDKMSDKMAEHVPGYMPNRMPEHTSNKMPHGRPHRMPDGMSEYMPENMSAGGDHSKSVLVYHINQIAAAIETIGTVSLFVEPISCLHILRCNAGVHCKHISFTSHFQKSAQVSTSFDMSSMCVYYKYIYIYLSIFTHHNIILGHLFVTAILFQWLPKARMFPHVSVSFHPAWRAWCLCRHMASERRDVQLDCFS